MIRRLAAALLCGAAAVHFADAGFYLAQATGLSGTGFGRGGLLLLLVIPAAILSWLAWDRGAACWAFLIGACAAYAADEWLLVPRLGWGWTSALWLALCGLSRFLRERDTSEADSGRLALVRGGAVIFGLAAGFAFAAVRPFLFQHVAGTRHGLRIAVLTGLVGLTTGAALGQALKRGMRARTVAVLGSVLAGLGAVTTVLLLPRASGGLMVPLLTGPWSLTWWGRSLIASWVMLGLFAVALGLILPLFNRRAAVVAIVVGLGLGTMLGEAWVRSLGSDPARARALADKVARHPALQRIEAATIGPEGIWTRYRTRSVLEIESIGHWQGTKLDRGELWKNLEAAEVEPKARTSVPDPGTLFDTRSAAAGLNAVDAVWPSLGYLAAGFTRRETVGWLWGAEDPPRVLLAFEKSSARLRSFRDWCDPRALTPAGLRSLLATWREALPDATFSVLIDGYGGPLLGIRVGGDPARFPMARQLTIFEAKASAAFRGELGPVSTTWRPVLEWETAPEPSPFIHPTADVMRALVDALAIDPGSTAGHLLRGLLLHAEAQVVRPYVVSAWDHVAIPEAEVREYMAALAKDDASPRIVQHLQIVFEVLSKKREYAMLVRHLEEAVARRPDVFAFHRTLGKTYADILKFPDAVEELQHAVAIDPDHHEAAIELSRALGGAKRWREAVTLLEAQLRKHDEPDVRKGLAIALTEAGDLDRARALIRELAASYPADIDIMRAQDRLKTAAESRAAESR